METTTQKIDKSSIQIGWNGSPDYPEFSNAYLESATWEDGTEMTEDELDQWQDENSMEFYDITYQSLI